MFFILGFSACNEKKISDLEQQISDLKAQLEQATDPETSVNYKEKLLKQNGITIRTKDEEKKLLYS